MQSVIENLGGLSRKIKVTVPQEQIKEEFDKRINDLAKKANIKGFRKGKVPASVVKLQYGDAIRQEIIQDILSKTLPQAFKEQNINPVSISEIEVINIKEDAPLEYEARFEIYPEVKLNLEGVSVEKPRVKIEEQQVRTVIEQLRQQNVKLNEVDRAAKKGDVVIIDFEGYVDEKLIEDGSAENFRLELGKKMMIPGFEDPIYGAKAGDAIDISTTFPEDYHKKQYAGKPVKFVVTLNKVLEPELPELDDDFAKDLGVSEGTLAGLNEEVRENLERELDRRVHEKVKAQIIDKVLEQNQIEVPQASVEEEVKRLQQIMHKQLAQTGSKDATTLSRENFEEVARKNVILGLLLAQWIQDNEIKLDDTKVRDRVDQIASGYHRPEEIVTWYYSNKGALSEIQAAVLEEQAISAILDKIEVVEKDVTFDEIMAVTRGEE